MTDALEIAARAIVTLSILLAGRHSVHEGTVSQRLEAALAALSLPTPVRQDRQVAGEGTR